MRFSRNRAVFLNHLINDWLPPGLRDSRWFMGPLFRMAFGREGAVFLEFRDRAYGMTEEQYAEAYRKTDSLHLLKGSDLNRECLDRIPREVVGETVLDAGCGRGLLAELLSARHRVTACDIVLANELRKSDVITYVRGHVEHLPFEDNAFDTVVCTHVLEHVRDVPGAIAELRRVARRRLIVVVPRERPYRFGFNLHLSFFPYRYSLENTFGVTDGQAGATISLEGGDWFLIEDQAARGKGAVRSTRSAHETGPASVRTDGDPVAAGVDTPRRLK